MVAARLPCRSNRPSRCCGWILTANPTSWNLGSSDFQLGPCTQAVEVRLVDVAPIPLLTSDLNEYACPFQRLNCPTSGRLARGVRGHVGSGVKSSLLPFLSPALGLEIGPVLDFHELVADGQDEEAPSLRIVALAKAQRSQRKRGDYD